MADRLTPRERDAIETAKRDGKVRKVGRKRSPRPAPPVDWGQIAQQQVTGSLQRSALSKPLSGPISTLRILDWAFRLEAAQLELPQPDAEDRGYGFGVEYVMIQRAKLGCTVQGGGSNDPCEEAEVVAAIVSGLPDRLGGPRMALRVVHHARSGIAPDWMQGVRSKYEPVQWQETAYGRRAKERTLEEIRVRINGKMRPRVVKDCPIMLVPSPQVLQRARADYGEWWWAIDYIRQSLQACGMLRRFTVTGDMPDARPWRDDPPLLTHGPSFNLKG